VGGVGSYIGHPSYQRCHESLCIAQSFPALSNLVKYVCLRVKIYVSIKETCIAIKLKNNHCRTLSLTLVIEDAYLIWSLLFLSLLLLFFLLTLCILLLRWKRTWYGKLLLVPQWTFLEGEWQFKSAF